MATALQSEAGGKSPGSLRCFRERRRVTAPSGLLLAALVAIWGATAAGAWASLSSALLQPGAGKSSRVRELSGSNWSLLLEGQWMVEFYAPWCPACQQMESAWEAFARNSENLELSVGKVDVTQEPGVSGRFFVTTLPTIYHAKDGVFRRYRGSRTLEDLEGYILERKWEAVEPVAGWKSPSSIVMHGMAGFFCLSGWIRQIHNYLTGTLGFHVWGSYAVFILAILLIGLILALILVLLTDFIFPPKSKAEEFDVIDSSDEKAEDALEHRVEDLAAEKDLLEDGEEESPGNSPENSAGEESETEEDSEHRSSDKVQQGFLRQRKNPVGDDGL
uniref:Thioredoxin related transmembrane protein 4 n=1 Tax=Salvator merianae TaxID=96440 RepID=A0A8D0KNT4_SALMN